MTGHYKEPYSDTIDQLRAENKELLEALKIAFGTIRAWHGEIAWDLYQDSPEMKIINAAIAKCEGK